MKLDIAELKKRLQARSALAITLESNRIAVTQMRYDGTKTVTQQSLSVPMGDEEVLKDPAKAGQMLATALAAAGLREKRCVVCVPPGWVLTASTDLPEVDDADLRAYLELRAEREFTVQAGDLRLGFCAYDLPNGQRRATLAALPARKLDAVQQLLAASNRDAVSVSLALDDILAEPQSRIHFLTNGNHTDVVVTAGGGVAGLRSLPGPVLTDGAQFNPATFCRDVRITLGRLPEPVRQQVRDAVFAGPSAKVLCTATRTDLLRMGIQTPECADSPEAASPTAPGAAVAAARVQLRSQPVAFEFIVPEVSKWQETFTKFDSSGRRKAVIAGVCLILLPILILFIRSEMESYLQNKWAAMSGKAADLDDLQKQIRQFQPWFEPNPVGLQLFQNIVSAFPDTGEVWAKSIKMDEASKVTCTGFARTEGALSSLLGRLRGEPGITQLQVQQIRGENPVQFTLIFQWQAHHD